MVTLAHQSTSDAGAVENSNDWRESLPEDLRNHGDIKSAESIADLAKRYTGARAKMSRMVNIPSHEAGSEEMSEFYDKVEAIDGVVRIPPTDDKDGWDKLYQRIGVPTDADQYAIEDKDLAGKLHALSLNGGQAEAVARMISGASETTKQAMEAVAQEGHGRTSSLGGAISLSTMPSRPLLRSASLAVMRSFSSYLITDWLAEPRWLSLATT